MRASAIKIVIGSALVLAVPPVVPAAYAAGAHAQYCVVEAVAADAARPTRSAPPRCFESFTAAIEEATGGTVRLPLARTDVSQAQLDAGRARDRLATTVIGIEYEDSDFGGTQWIISQASGCNDGGAEVWLRADLTGTAMNNVISSARTYAGCKSRHFENANFLGASYLCGCSQMGSMSDKTTSIRWSATGF